MRLAALAPAPAPAGPSTGPSRSTRPCWPTCAGAPGGRPSRRPPAWSSTAAAGWRPGPTAGTGDLDRGRRPGHASKAGCPSGSGPSVVLGRAGFADDTCPADALVAVPDGAGGYVVAESRRRRPGPWPARSRGASTSLAARPPGGRAPGRLGPHPADHLGGAGLRRAGRLVVRCPAASRRRPSATAGPSGGSCTRRWPPTPGGWPTSTGARSGSSGRGRTWSATAPSGRRWPAGSTPTGPGSSGSGSPPTGCPATGGHRWWPTVAAVAPGLVLEPVPLVGPAVSFDLRAAVWAEAAVLAACARMVGGADGADRSPTCPSRSPPRPGAGPSARCRADGSIEVAVEAGEVLDEVVLRSYCIGAAHQALGWVALRGHRRGRRRDGPRPDHAVVRDPPGPGHAPGDGRVAGGRRPARRSTAPTPCSPRWPRPAGWPTGSRPAGPPTGGRRRAGARAPAGPRSAAPPGRPPVPGHTRSMRMSTPIGPYTPIVRAGPWLICSGQLGLRPTPATPTVTDAGPASGGRGRAGPADPGPGQRRATARPTTAPPSSDVVKTTVFVTDMDRVRRGQRGLRRPSSATTARPARWWRWPASRWGPPSRSRCGPTCRPDRPAG